MSGKLVFVLSSFLWLSFLLYVRFNPVEVKASEKYPVHNLDTGLNYTSIQAAINAPETLDGHMIQVDAGTYFEHVTIAKSISLVGEDRDATIVDGNGTGTVIKISASDVHISNFTIRNAGREWGPPPGLGYPDSCILGSGVAHIYIENNTFTGAAVCVLFVYSSFVNVSDNVVFDATYAGIIGYGSSNIAIYRNLVYDCGLMGIHLDGGSDQCRIVDNTVMNNLEGMELEAKSARNLIEENSLIGNNVSIVLNRCGGLNVFRRNNMTGSQYNLIVLGYSLDSFLQDIDDSNIVNNKTVYYLTNLHDLIIDPSDCPNPGYLAIINCTNITIRDFNITQNGDGILLAYSTNCTLTNVTLNGNRGPLIYGGLTFYRSNNNKIIHNNISDNSYAVCLYHSDGNVFYYNSFIHNDREVVSDFLSPFSDKSSGYFSLNIWDNGFEGNYWGNYTGEDQNGDGIGDTPYVIDENNQDNYPLMKPWIVIEEVPPFWMQWWFWSLVAAGILVSAGAVYFLNKRKSSTPTASSSSCVHKDNMPKMEVIMFCKEVLAEASKREL